jgi:hypothetical protein
VEIWSDFQAAGGRSRDRMMWLPETRLAAGQPEPVGPPEGPAIMTPERTGAQVIDLASERPRLMEARRQRVQRALVEIIRELRLQDSNRALMSVEPSYPMTRRPALAAMPRD